MTVKTQCKYVGGLLSLVMGFAASGQTVATSQGQAATSIAPCTSETQPVAGLAADASVPAILEALEASGRDLRNFSASVSLHDSDAITQDESTRLGKVYYQKLPDGAARLRAAFTTLRRGALSQTQMLDYLLEGGWLIERNEARKIEVRRQVLRPGEKINLLKLGEGPFPLPIGQSPAEVQRLFDVSKIPVDLDDPARTLHLRLVPRPGTQFEKKFASLDVWVDREHGFPRRIDTLDKNQTLTRGTDLTDLVVNGQIADEQFKLPAIDASQWQKHEEAFSE